MRVTTTTLSSSTTFLSVSLGCHLWTKSISLPVDLKERKLWDLMPHWDSLLFVERGQAQGKPPLTRTFTDTKPSHNLLSSSNGRLHWGRRSLSLSPAKMKSGEKILLSSIVGVREKINPLYHRTSWVRKWIMYSLDSCIANRVKKIKPLFCLQHSANQSVRELSTSELYS